MNLEFPTPGIPLFPGVFLTRVGAGVGLNPTRILGGARVSALAVFRIDGTLVLAMPSTAAPFRLTREESGGGFPARFYDRTYPRFTMALGGEAFLKLPLHRRPDPARRAATCSTTTPATSPSAVTSASTSSASSSCAGAPTASSTSPAGASTSAATSAPAS